ncbi:MAG: thiol-disulfide oxidoreductase DCC family protein [Thermoguttaceae bacterium]
MSDVKTPLILFDGVCNLCNGVVRFIVARDRSRCFYFASRQSELGREVLRRHGLDCERDDTIVLVEGERAFLRSGAALRIASRLRWPWPLLYGLIVVPRFIRDGVYRWIAARRYRWFGRSDACPLPPGGLDGRFLS